MFENPQPLDPSDEQNATHHNPTESDTKKITGRNVMYVPGRDLEDKYIKSPTEERLAKAEERIRKYGLLPNYLKGDNEHSPEFRERIMAAEADLIRFADCLGVDIRERLPREENIYEFEAETFEKLTLREDPKATSFPMGLQKDSEIAVRSDCAEPIMRKLLQHELVHNVCLNKFSVRTESFPPAAERIDRISSGYAGAGGFDGLNEGLTEIMTEQILIEQGYAPETIGYAPHIILITELAKDMAAKLTFDREKICNMVDFPNAPEREITQKDILSYLEVGMLNSDRRYLKIISSLYDNKEAKEFKSIQGLMKLGSDEDYAAILELAETFRLEEAVRKLKLCADKERAEGFKILLGDQSIDVPSKKNI